MSAKDDLNKQVIKPKRNH